jgi:hypothetical protein
MELRELSRKQKRLNDWSQFLKSETTCTTPLGTQMAELLKRYRNLLARCWEEEFISENEQHALEDLERQLQQTMNDLRLVG